MNGRTIYLLLIAATHLLFSVDLFAQRFDSIDPVRPGDKVEYKWFSDWKPATVLSYADGVATVEYPFGSSTLKRDYKLKDLRFPNGEGPWMLWSDKSGKFKVEARYVARTATHVTIRKDDGSESTVPIEILNPLIRKEIAKTPISGEENKFDGAVPVKLGDKNQAKSFSTWYDGTVKEVKREGAVVEYKYGSFGMRSGEFKFADMRFPNGEGPWREWSDASGDFKIIARYISRDETHVTIRKEDGANIRVEIALLNPALRKQLSATESITPRPREVEFNIPSGMFTGKHQIDALPSLEHIALQVSALSPAADVRLSQGGVAFELEQGDKVSGVIPIGGEEQWVVVGTYGKGANGPAPAQLFWASPGKKTKVVGPKLLSDERVRAYSAQQARLITAEVRGTWNVPVRLCSYRIRPGETKAVPEMCWKVPKPSGASSSSAIHLELLGQDRLLMGYGSSVSLWNLSTKTADYSVNGLSRPKFWLSPDQRYFAVFDSRQSLSLHDTVDGDRVSRDSWEEFGFASAGFSQDGRHLVCATRSEIKAWSLTEEKPMIRLPLGGISVGDNTPLSLLKGGWVVAGPQFYSVGLKMVVWRYDYRGVSLQHQQMLGHQMLAVAIARGRNSTNNVLVGVASVPHKDAIALMKKVDTTKLHMMKRGSRIRVEKSGNSKIDNGLQQAVAANGWVVDPASEVVLSGSAGLGKSETRTYRVISFGGGGGPSEETHTVQPWIQSVSISYGDQSAWGTSTGGVPFSVMMKQGGNLGAELGKSSNPQYSLFENLKIPEEILYPRYQRGLGQTWITTGGFVDEAK